MKWYDDWEPLFDSNRGRSLAKRLEGSKAWVVVAVDLFFVGWASAACAMYNFAPLPFEGWGLLGASAGAGLVALGALWLALMAIGPLLVGFPVWFIMLHVQAWRDYVPTSSNQARWVVEALAKSKQEGG